MKDLEIRMVEDMKYSVLEARNLNVVFSRRQVVSDFSLAFKHGNITSVIGPSGSGKSTLLRTLNRMTDHIPEAQVDGDVLFHGKSIWSNDTEAADIRRKIGLVFQNSRVFRKSIFENVAFGLRVSGWRDSGRIEHQVAESLRKVHLWDRLKDSLDIPASRLTREQQQRLCLARALAVSPEVLLIDEPTGDLDSGATSRIEVVLRDLREKHTIVVVTHNLHQAARLSDVTAFLYFGNLVECRDTRTFFTNPEMKLTEDYLTGGILGDER